jgi:phosphoesterase RecJ-like protein
MSADMGKINTILFESKPLSKVRATAMGLNGMKIVQDGKIAYTVIDNQLKQRGGFAESDFEDLVGKMREIEGVELSYMIRQSGSNPGEYKISTRSKEFFDCTELCGIFGGGGHLRAAGATVTAANPAIAEKLVLTKACSLMEKYIKER